MNDGFKTGHSTFYVRNVWLVRTDVGSRVRAAVGGRVRAVTGDRELGQIVVG